MHLSLHRSLYRSLRLRNFGLPGPRCYICSGSNFGPGAFAPKGSGSADDWLLYRKYYEEDAGLHDLYSSILPAVNYLVYVSLTCTQLFSICMRCESYSLLLQGFFTRVHAVQEEIHLRGMQKKWGLRTLIDGISQG